MKKRDRVLLLVAIILLGCIAWLVFHLLRPEHPLVHTSGTTRPAAGCQAHPCPRIPIEYPYQP
jgi:hypothetical protein